MAHPRYMLTNPLPQQVADRIGRLRASRAISVETLAQAMGLAGVGPLVAIESGERPIEAPELLAAARGLGVTTDVLLDPFRLVAEGACTVRASDARLHVVDYFQEDAGRWFAMWRLLRPAGSLAPGVPGLLQDLRPDSPLEAIDAAAGRVRDAFGMGVSSAEQLEQTIATHLDAHVLTADAPPAIAAATIWVEGTGLIFVNRQRSKGERAHEVARQLFHLLTWTHLPPPRLMPIGRLAETEAVDPLESRAERFATTLLGATTPPGTSLTAPADPALRFSAPFVRAVHAGIESGRLSVRRAAALLGMSLHELSELCGAYGVALSYEF